MLNDFNRAFSSTLSRELKRMVSRPVYFIITILILSFCYFFFLTLFDEGQPNDMPIAIVDLDNSALTQKLARNFDATQKGKVVMKLGSHKEARLEMQKGNIYAFVEFENGFSKKSIAGLQPKIQLYLNDSYLIAGSLLGKDLMYMSASGSAGMKRKILRARGTDESKIMGLIQPIVVDAHLIGNPYTNYGVYMLNILFPGVLQLMVLITTIFAIGVEFKERSSKLWMDNANNSLFAAISGKLFPYTVIFTVMGIIGNSLLFGYMHFPLHTNVGWMFVNIFLLVIAYQSIGVLLIGVTPVLRDGVTLAAIFGLLGISFSGCTFPIEQMPYYVRILSDFFPIRHYFLIYANNALNGFDITHSFNSFFILIAFNVLPLFVYNRLKNAAIKQNFPIK